MKRVSMFLLGFLIVTLVLPFYRISEVKAQESSSFGNASVPDIAFVNWTRFWSLFNSHSGWDLEYNNGSGWNSIKSDLQVIKNYTVFNEEEWIPVNKSKATTCKITLNFTASYNADYRLTFGIDLDVKNYTHKTSSWNYTIRYKNYTVVFDWSDIKDLPLDYVGHGVKPVGDESWFWFRIRKDDVPEGMNVVIDPRFGYETAGASIHYGLSGDAFHAHYAYAPAQSGNIDSITANIGKYSAGGTVAYALYSVESEAVLIDYTEEGSLPASVTWLTLDAVNGNAITQGTNYMFVIWVSAPLNWRYNENAGSGKYRGYAAGTYDYPNFPNPLGDLYGDDFDEHRQYNIFCNYTTGGAQEYTEEFTETIGVSASVSFWKALSEKYSETITVSATSYGWKEKAIFYTETTQASEQMNKYAALLQLFTETIVVTETSSFTMEIMMAFLEFTETINLDVSLALWKAKQFFIDEKTGVTDTFYNWISLTESFFENVETSESRQFLREKLLIIIETIEVSASLEILKETLVTFIEFSELIQFDADMILTFTLITPKVEVTTFGTLALVIAIIALAIGVTAFAKKS